MLRKLAIGLGLLTILLLGLLWLGLRHYLAEAAKDPAFFERDIRAFEAADRETPPTPGGVVFFGSSSIRFWSGLVDDMAPLPAINRGFGGAQLSHLVHNVDRVVLPYEPRAVVVYAGDNDLADGTGKDVERVVADYRELVARIHAADPELPVYFLAIKPSRLRWDRWPDMRRANAAIEAITAEDDRLAYIDVATPMLGEDGEPRRELFVLDGLHLSDAGYALWTTIVRPRLLADLSEGTGRAAGG